MKELIRHRLREETQAQKKLVSIINKVGFETAIDAVGGIDRFLTVMDGYDYLTPSNIEKLIQYELDKIREESEVSPTKTVTVQSFPWKVSRITTPNTQLSSRVDRLKKALASQATSNRQDHDNNKILL